VPRAWFDQLVDGGLIEVPLRLTGTGAHVIATLRKGSGRLTSESALCGGFMPLRGPDDEGLPAWLPTLTAAGPQPPDTICSLSGTSLATLSAKAQRRLLSTALGEPRRRRLPRRLEAEPLLLYLTLTLPSSRSVTAYRDWPLGLISRDGASLAYVLPSRGRRSIATLAEHGDARAGGELAGRIDEWVRRGRPGPRELRLQVDYRDAEQRIAWRFVTSA
jgi:hypothetical protein